VALLEAAGTPGASRPAGGARKRSAARPGAGYRIAELYIERRGGRSIVGNIYKGKVDNVLPGLEAAFVDIGLEKNGFLHVDEIVLPGVEAPKRGRGGGRKIAELLKPGQEIVVQVVKDPLKTKGARLSMELTIAGRYLVYAPTGEGIGVSRRLEDKERERLRRQTAKLEIGQGGVIIRTAAHGAQRADFERELLYLHKLHEVLMKRVADTQAPEMVFQEADLSVRVVRDIYSADFDRAIVDDPKQHHRLLSFFSRTAPELVEHVELWEEPEPLFESFGVENPDNAAAVADEALAFEIAGGDGGGGPGSAQHIGQQLMRHFEGIAVGAVGTDQQPAGEPWHGQMLGIAADRLSRLVQLSLDIAQGEILKIAAELEFFFCVLYAA